MQKFGDISIRTKITLSFVLISAAVSVAGAFLVWSDIQTMRGHLISRTADLAEMLGANARYSMASGDVIDEAEFFESLKLNSSVEFACLFDKHGTVLATYGNARSESPVIAMPIDSVTANEFGNQTVDVWRPIFSEGRRQGSILIRTSTSEFNRQVFQYAIVVSLLITFLLTINFVIARVLRLTIYQPIVQMANVLQRISADDKYTRRSSLTQNDEIGVLSKGLNRMLERVEHRDLEIQNLNKELAISAEYANSANAAKTDFLANMSHEIRTPMTAVLGFADMLLAEEGLENAPEHRIESFRTIKRNADYLLGIINDVLDISKIEAGKVDVENISCCPGQIIAEVANLTEVQATSKGLSLAVEYETPIPKTITSDPTRLRQILINLVGNALKFTECGGVKIIPRLIDANAMEPTFQIDIVDTGIGMSEPQMEKLFEPFSQADASTTRKFGGTGLGLTISERLAQMLGGGISIQSREGEGSTFTVSISTGNLDGIPLVGQSVVQNDRPNDASVLPLEDGSSLDCRVLLAEDGLDNQRLISYILKKAGAEVEVVDNGQSAFESAIASETQGSHFDVILMDMQMPILDGYGATGKLREVGYEGPILALTAHAMAEDRQKCLDAGCDDYATKPIDRQKLLSLVAKYSQWSERMATTSSP